MYTVHTYIMEYTPLLLIETIKILHSGALKLFETFKKKKNTENIQSCRFLKNHSWPKIKPSLDTNI